MKSSFLYSWKVGLRDTLIIHFPPNSRKTVADFVTDFVTDCVTDFCISSRW